jgi:hypothetical protein
VIDPGQYAGGELLVLSTRCYDFACSFTGGYGGVYDDPGALGGDYAAYAVAGPGGPRFLLFRDADGVVEGSDADGDPAVWGAHYPNFRRARWVFNWAVPSGPDVVLPDGYAPARVAVAAPFRHDVGLERGRDLAAAVGVGAGAAGSVAVREDMTADDIHAAVAAFFGGEIMALQQFISPNANSFGRAHGLVQEDPRLAMGQERAMGYQQEAGSNYRAGLQADTARAGLAQSQSRYNQLLPMLQGELSSSADMGQSGSGRPIDAGPVWNQQQIGQQVNAAQARNNAGTQSQQRGLQQSFAGRGFSSNSPLLQSLSTGLDMGRMRQNAEDTRQINWDSAQGNAQQLLAGQQAQEQQYANRMQEDIERRKAAATNKVSLLGMMAGLV